ncbi:hypothetical protein HBA54_22830 [Pelagibius litoralis]|uniref:Enamine deaminase RidA, house cleaning of reactive enamine intermediates, YjgF/YER057c/UK114 family n=1 Tax=Pelagibius litoralis TaxID=374515 RepID=A0A967F1I0_9PROT|nr:hypothetical protein [Pelagibius litoralis]
MKENRLVIERVHGPAKGRCLATSYEGLVYAVAYDPVPTPNIKEQTKNALDFLDQRLAEADSDKKAILQATVYLHDMTMKAEMDDVWCDWIGPRALEAQPLARAPERDARTAPGRELEPRSPLSVPPHARGKAPGRAVGATAKHGSPARVGIDPQPPSY